MGNKRNAFLAEEEVDAAFRGRGRDGMRRKLLLWLFFGLFIALLVAGMALVPRIQTYKITGSQQLDIREVMEANGLVQGMHFFSIDQEALGEKIGKDPYYVVRGIVYHFPGTLEIIVSERNQDACIRYLNKDIVISSDGTVLEVGDSGDFPGVIRIQGLTVTGYALGERIGVQDDFQLSIAEKVLDVLHDSGYVVDYDLIDLSTPVDVKLLSKNRITVRIGQLEDVEAKLFKAAALLRQLADEGYTGGVLDATTDRLAYRNSTMGGIDIPEELMGLIPEEGDVEAENAWEEQSALSEDDQGFSQGSGRREDSGEGRQSGGSSTAESSPVVSTSPEVQADLPEEGEASQGDEQPSERAEGGSDILDEMMEEETTAGDEILPGLATEGE